MDYISKMHKNIHEIVNFEKLKKSNDLCFKWGKRLKIPRRDYMKFITILQKSPDSLIEKIKSRYVEEYKSDLANMFYAKEVENILAQQYHAMIFSIMKKMRINPEQYDDFISDGFLAIRSSIWQYRTHKVKASFTTFVHKAIFFRIKGQINRIKLKKERRKNFNLYYESGYEGDSFDLNLFSKNIEVEHSNNFEKELNNIISISNLTDQEECMLRCFINRKIDELWYAEYLKKFVNTKTQKPYSRQSIYNQLLAVQKKVAKHMRVNNLLDNDFVVPTTHYGDLR